MNQADRAAYAQENNMLDLGPMPEKIREIAYAWSCCGTYPPCPPWVYQLASTDGMTANLAALREEVATITVANDRTALESWLDGQDKAQKTVKRTIGRFAVIPIEVEKSDGIPAPREPAIRVQVGERWIRLMGKFETEAQIEAALAKMEVGQ